MTNIFRVLLLGVSVAFVPLKGVYAPVPEQELGKDLTVSLRGGISYDSNLFGAAQHAVGSTIYTLAPHISYEGSFTDQTFLAAAYGLTLDEFDNRPGDKLLDSHDATLRFAHAFSKSTNVDVTESLSISRNPEALLAGVPLNPDQSFTRNQIDGRFFTPLNAKAGVTVKARSVYFKYRNDALGRSLDHIENLYGVAGDYAVLPEVKAVAEYRHEDIYYRKEGEIKNKSSDFLMGGADYAVARKLSVSGRLGAEFRRRSGQPDATAPFAEFSTKYDYTEKSFVVGGVGYNFEETSDTARFNDEKLLRMFVNVQHQISALIVGSASVSYEPGTLQGRRGVADVDEKTTRLGGAISYLPTKNWLISGSADYDHTRSDDPVRNLNRRRVGLSATYSF